MTEDAGERAAALARQAERARLGRAAEDLAESEMARRGHAIVARNLRAPWGELDIIARKGRQVVIVEVRSRSLEEGAGPDDDDQPAGGIREDKRRKVRLTAQRWLDGRPIDYDEVRMFVVLVWWGQCKPTLRVIEDAF